MSWFARLSPAERTGLLVVGLVIVLLIIGGAIFISTRQAPTAAVPPTPTALVMAGLEPTPTSTPLVVGLEPTSTATPLVVTATPTSTPVVVTATPVPGSPAAGVPTVPVPPEQVPEGRIPPTDAPAIGQPPTEPPAQPPTADQQPGGQQPQPGQPAPVEIRNASSYKDQAGATHIVGEIFNRSTAPSSPMTVTATLYDANNGVIGTATAVPQPQPVAPGARAAFDATISSPPANLHHFGLTGSAVTTSAPVRLDLQPVDPVSSIDAAAGLIRVRGQIRNTAGEARQGVSAVGVFYDAGGKVLRVASTQTNPPDIPAGGAAPFDLAVPSAAQIQRYDLLVGAR